MMRILSKLSIDIDIQNDEYREESLLLPPISMKYGV